MMSHLQHSDILETCSKSNIIFSLPQSKLQVICVALLLSVKYPMLCLLVGFLNSQQINRINDFFGKARRFWFCSSPCPCDVSQYQIPDSKLWNHSHCLSHLFSPKNHLRLRPGGHKYPLPICPNNLTKRSFRPPCLFRFLWSVCFIEWQFMSFFFSLCLSGFASFLGCQLWWSSAFTGSQPKDLLSRDLYFVFYDQSVLLYFTCPLSPSAFQDLPVFLVANFDGLRPILV